MTNVMAQVQDQLSLFLSLNATIVELIVSAIVLNLKLGLRSYFEVAKST